MIQRRRSTPVKVFSASTMLKPGGMITSCTCSEPMGQTTAEAWNTLIRDAGHQWWPSGDGSQTEIAPARDRVLGHSRQRSKEGNAQMVDALLGTTQQMSELSGDIRGMLAVRSGDVGNPLPRSAL